MTLRFGIIPTNGRDCVRLAIDSLLHQVDYLAVIEAGVEITHLEYPPQVTVLTDDTKMINISRWWNKGFDWAQAVATASGASTWDVAVLNDDVEVPPTWLCYIADDMRVLGCVAASSGGRDGSPVIHRATNTPNLFNRIQGFAFVVAGESGIRADEQYRWYFSDDALGYIAASMGGAVMFPRCDVTHRYPNLQVSAEMHIMIAEDAAKFRNQWGHIPS